MPETRKRIAVLGAGPKAAALAAWGYAWAATRRALGATIPLPEAPEVLVFDSAHRGGAAWVGGIGYSDGTPELCTPHDADVTNGAGGAVPVAPASQAHVASQLLAELAPFAYPHPAVPDHATFGDYVDDVLQNASSGTDVRLFLSTPVTEIAPAAHAGWTVTAGGVVHPVDGVVVTGPGPHRPPIDGTPGVATMVRNAADYWSTPYAQRVAMATGWLGAAGVDGSPHVVIAGTGGAAAAIALDLCRVFAAALAPATVDVDDDGGVALRITFVAPRAGLLTRGESEWETRVLRDAEAWDRLSVRLRAEANDHLLSGVIFRRVLEELEYWLDPTPPAQPVSIEVEPGRVIWVDDGTDTSWDLPQPSGPLRVVVSRATEGLVVHGAHFFVNAIGFDPRWFLTSRLLKPEGVAKILGAIDLPNVLDDALAVELRAQLGDTASSFPLAPLRFLHLPMFAGGRQPPGFGNLLNLGGLAERIMRRYF